MGCLFVLTPLCGYKTWTLHEMEYALDNGVDYELDFGLDFGLDSRTYKLSLGFQAFPTIQFLIACSLMPKVRIIQISMHKCQHLKA